MQRTIAFPEAESIQEDGRIRRWAKVEEMDGRYLSLRVGQLTFGMLVKSL